jgi:hypothetical protein
MTRTRGQKVELAVSLFRRAVVVTHKRRPLSVATDATVPEVKRLIEKMINQHCVGRMCNLYDVEAGTGGDVASRCEGGVVYDVVTDEVAAEAHPKQDEINRHNYRWHFKRDMEGEWRLVDE